MNIHEYQAKALLKGYGAPVAQGVPVYCLNMPNGRLTLRGLVKLWRLFKSIGPTILQTWLYHADLLGIIFGKLSGIRNVCWNVRCSYHDLEKYRFSTKWTMKMCSIFSSIPDVVIANSNIMIYDPLISSILPIFQELFMPQNPKLSRNPSRF